jgi:alpha-1,6-mannosyltransferase
MLNARNGSRPIQESSNSGLALFVSLVVALALVALGLLFLRVPYGFSGSWGLTIAGAEVFKSAIPPARALRPLQTETFVWYFRVLLLLAWLSWSALVLLGLRGRLPSRRVAHGLVVLVGLYLAVFAPPVLSGDVLGYTAKGHMLFPHGLNPYESGRPDLEALGDPTARFLSQIVRLPYGPLWTLVAAGFAAAGSLAGFFVELLAHKIWAGVSLIASAAAGARLAEGRERGRGRLALLAIGLNPLLLLEGPANGHNDLAMMAPLMWSAALHADGRKRAGALALGLAAAIKPVALAAVPFLLYVEYIRKPSHWRDVGVALVLIAAPSVVLSLAFGGPLELLRSVRDQAETAPTGLSQLAGWLLLAASFAWGLWLAATETGAAGWLTGWIPLSAALVLVASRYWYPWYFTWALIPALTGWNERHRLLTLSISTVGFFATWLYTVGPR